MKLLRPVLALAGLVALAASLPAQFVWTGSSAVNGSILDSNNWAPNTPPVPSGSGTETLTFGNFAGSQVNVLFPTIAVQDIDLIPGHPTMTFYGLSGTPTLTLNGSINFTSSSSFYFDSSLNVALSAGNHNISAPNGAIFQITSAISGAGGLTVTGPSLQVNLISSNTYAGGTTVDGGAALTLNGSISHSTADTIVGLTSGTSGTLVVGAGTISDNQGRLGIGATAQGIANLDGSGTAWNNAGYLYVGESGTGQIYLTNSATASSANTSIGNNTGGSGYISLDNSTLTQTGNLYVGSQGTGLIDAINGSHISDVTGSIGNNSGGTGGVLVRDPGSVWANSGDLHVGDQGDGTLDIAATGTVNVGGNFYVGTQSGSNGVVTIHDPNTNLNVSGAAYIGYGGVGELFLQAGAINVGNGNGVIYLGNTATGAGTLLIGDMTTGQGVVNATAISTGAGGGILDFATFSSASNPYYLTKDGTASGVPVVVAGNTIVNVTSGYNVINGNNTYTGGTTVQGGGTLVAGSNTALGTGLVTTIGAGSVLTVASGVTINNPINTTLGGTLAGNGTFGSAVTIGSTAYISPGDLVGKLTFSNGLTLDQSGGLAFQVQTAGGAAGTGYDLVNVSGGTLNITSTSGNPFKIYLYSLNSSGAAGPVGDFSSSTGYAWVLFTSTSLTNFAANKFAIDTTNFSNSLGIGGFSVVQSGNQIILDFSPVPEPSTWAMLASGLGMIVWAVCRRRATA